MLTGIYKALILSKINYGLEFLRVANKKSLITVDVIQNSCSRLVLGAEHKSPISSMEVEAYIPPLNVQRRICMCNFLNRLRACRHLATYDPGTAYTIQM